MRGERESHCGSLNVNWIFDEALFMVFLKSVLNFYLLELHNEIIYSINNTMPGICFKSSNEDERLGGTDETRVENYGS